MNVAFVYGIYTKAEQLIYVGVTYSPKTRWIAHRCDRNAGKAYEWSRITGDSDLDFRIIGVYDILDEAMAAEEAIIRAVKPPLNRYVPPLIDPRTDEPWSLVRNPDRGFSRGRIDY